MPVDHYENFPVASILLPRRLRPAVEAIYAFARSADDIADEGDASADERLSQLDAYRDGLAAIERGETPAQWPFDRLAPVVRQHGLSIQLLRDLLDAFSQDVVKDRYADFAELRDYTRRSADPVGRLMLRLFEADTPEHCAWSDAICTSLQLINFWQDVAIDWDKDRVYVPQDDCERFEVSEKHLALGRVDDAWRALMRFQVDRARRLMLSGAPLARRLPGRIGWEIRLVVQGGLRILEAIEAADYDVFRHRPTLKAGDWPRLVARACRMPA